MSIKPISSASILAPLVVSILRLLEKPYRLILLPAILVAILFSNVSFAQTITNDLTATSSNHYQVSGNDPYIIFNPKQQTEKASRYLSFDLGAHLIGIPLELFFSSQQDLFDPYYKISFTITNFPATLELPDGISFNESTRLRLDINQCQDCTVQLKSLPFLSHQVRSPATVIQPNRLQNGISPLANDSAPLDTNDWLLNGLSGVSNNFKISADDPFLASPKLTLSTQKLAGAYFKLKVPKSNEAWNDYQLFYQTERHTFTAQASSTLRIANSANGIVEFMFPLGFLNNEQPSVAVLERIRLDIPEISGNWALLEARLVHQDQLNDYVNKIPTRLLEIKQQRAIGLSLIKKSLLNIVADIGFSISYLLLLILSAWFLTRAYRASH